MEASEIPFNAEQLGNLVILIDKGTISSSIGKKVLEELQEYLQYDITYDNSDNVILKEEIDSLRPDEAVMLGKYVVFQKAIPLFLAGRISSQ